MMKVRNEVRNLIRNGVRSLLGPQVFVTLVAIDRWAGASEEDPVICHPKSSARSSSLF